MLRDDELYLGDNGRGFCGRRHRAGMTAHVAGRDLSGQPQHMGVTLAARGAGGQDEYGEARREPRISSSAD